MKSSPKLRPLKKSDLKKKKQEEKEKTCFTIYLLQFGFDTCRVSAQEALSFLVRNTQQKSFFSVILSRI